jgi:hypothetical protein
MIDSVQSPRARRWTRAGAALGGAVALFVAVGGFLHTSAGRPLLARLAGGGCPLGYEKKLEPAKREELRRLGLSKLVRNEKAARARPALGFELGKVGRTAIRAWASEHQLACRSESKGSGLACDAVPGELVGEAGGHLGTLYFRFDAKERLVGVLRMVRTADAERAVSLGEDERTKLHERLGEPTLASGELSVASLASGPLRQARTEFRYRDFSAFASVTNLGPKSYLVTEEAQLAD